MTSATFSSSSLTTSTYSLSVLAFQNDTPYFRRLVDNTTVYDPPSRALQGLFVGRIHTCFVKQYIASVVGELNHHASLQKRSSHHGEDIRSGVPHYYFMETRIAHALFFL